MLYPEFLDGFSDFGMISSWFTSVATSLGAILVAAAGIYLAFVGWRAFKAVVNKV